MPTTPRLPIPGSDDGTWGDVLNAFLLVSHDSQGELLNVARPADVATVSTAVSTLSANVAITETAAKAASYTAASGELVPVDTSALAVTITLPAATAGARVTVRWQAGANALTIAAAGTDKVGSGVATSITDMIPGEVRTLQAIPAGGRWQATGGYRPARTLSSVTDLDHTGAAVGKAVAVKTVVSGAPTAFELIAAVPTLLIATAAALPPGTPAGTIVVVKA